MIFLQAPLFSHRFPQARLRPPFAVAVRLPGRCSCSLLLWNAKLLVAGNQSRSATVLEKCGSSLFHLEGSRSVSLFFFHARVRVRRTAPPQNACRTEAKDQYPAHRFNNPVQPPDSPTFPWPRTKYIYIYIYIWLI